jgi:uncharacterized protein YjbK
MLLLARTGTWGCETLLRRVGVGHSLTHGRRQHVSDFPSGKVPTPWALGGRPDEPRDQVHRPSDRRRESLAPLFLSMETELKLSLNGADEAERLLRALPAPEQILRQRNVYFGDRRGLWSAARLSVRLRWIEAGCVLTVKGAGQNLQGFASRPEAERSLDASEIGALRGGGAELAAAAVKLAVECGMKLAADVLADSELRPIGEMLTLRRVCALPREFRDAPVLEVDETTYPDSSVVWEAELEVNRDNADLASLSQRLQDFFVAAGVGWRPSTLSKRRRLTQILDQMSA